MTPTLKTHAATGDTPDHLADLLAHQEKLDLVEQRRIDLDRAIAACERELSEAAANAPNIDHLLQRREDMLADRSIGAATQADIDALDKEIQHAERAISDKARAVAVRTSELTQALRGLGRKRDEAAAEIVELAAAGEGLMFGAIKSEMETVCEEYVEAALAVQSLFLRLVALERISMVFRSAGVGAVSPNAEMQLPFVRLPQCRGIANPWNESRGVLFATDSIFTNRIARAIDTERERLVTAGVRRYIA